MNTKKEKSLLLPKNPFYRKLALAIIGLKIALILLFTSNLQETLYIPFISQFLSNFQDPWQYFTIHNPEIKFPYPPLLLYIHALFYAPYYFFLSSIPILKNLFFKLPLLLSDILIFILFLKLFPEKTKEVLIFYFLSPIIIYVSYVYSQFDLIPVALLCLSIYWVIKKQTILAAIIFGFAISTKMPTATAFPLIFIYILRNLKKRDLLYFLTIPWGIYLFFCFPYLQSQGYQTMVVHNPEQSLLFTLFQPIGELKIYLAPLALFMIYIKFLLYKKVNQDLLFSFLALLFSTFILLIPPMPNWYVWAMPFISIFLILYTTKNKEMNLLYLVFLAVYFAYFIFCYNGNIFYPASLYDLNFLSWPIKTKFANELTLNIFFTMLEGLLASIIFFTYKYGVKSNSIYSQRKEPLIIGIAGDSSTGKTTLLTDIKNILGKNDCLAIEGDGIHRWEREDENWKNFTHLNPKANYLYRQSEEIITLKSGKPVEISEYDHATGKFSNPALVSPKDFILVCGLHSFYLPKTRKSIDIKIYMDTEEDLRRNWKIQRDTAQRGYDKDSVLKQIEKRQLDAEKYIYPQKTFSDIIIRYFTDQTESSATNIQLKVTLDSSIHLDRILDLLKSKNITYFHDYEMDLKAQYLILNGPLSVELLVKLTQENIPNIHEIIKEEITWQEGYRGFIQFIILYTISENLKNSL